MNMKAIPIIMHMHMDTTGTHRIALVAPLMMIAAALVSVRAQALTLGKTVRSISILGAAAIVVAFGTSAQAATRYISTNGSYTLSSIGYQTGDNVVIESSGVTLDCQYGTVQSKPTVLSAMDLEPARHGIWIRHPSVVSNANNRAACWHIGGITVKKCDVVGFASGIRVDAGNGVTIDDVYTYYNDDGYDLNYTYHGEVKNGYSGQNAGEGIDIDIVGWTTIRNNNISDNGDKGVGINNYDLYEQCPANPNPNESNWGLTVTANYIANNDKGINVKASYNGNYSGNTITGNRKNLDINKQCGSNTY